VRTTHSVFPMGPIVSNVVRGGAGAADTVVVATQRDCLDAIAAAVAIASDWAREEPGVRASCLLQASEVMLQNIARLAEVIRDETRKPRLEAEAEVRYGASFFSWFAKEARTLVPSKEPHPLGRLRIERRAVGPAAIITPWNFPIAMACKKLAPAFAAGCPVLWKPAPETPRSALALGSLLLSCGLPEGTLSVLPGSVEAIAETLIDHADVRKLSFTGSTQVGKQIAARAAQTLKRVSIELGGLAVAIVCPGADLVAAADAILRGKLRNAGQTCIAVQRVYCPRNMLNALIALLVERIQSVQIGTGDDATMGPLIHARAFEKVMAHVDNAKALGAATYRGKGDVDPGKNLCPPTVLVPVTDAMRIAQEEVFGPVLGCTPYDDLDEVITSVNQSPYALANYVFAKTTSEGEALAMRLACGMVGVNTVAISDAAVPFGGVRESGYGREGSTFGMDDYLQVHAVLIADTP
jgi:succinate-semialdehyde dehydrogenase / glutarate-semialdehyde dehydrogenase